jgi:hypothetical protein
MAVLVTETTAILMVYIIFPVMVAWRHNFFHDASSVSKGKGWRWRKTTFNAFFCSRGEGARIKKIREIIKFVQVINEKYIQFSSEPASLLKGIVLRDFLIYFFLHQSASSGHLIHWLQGFPNCLKILRAL